MSGLGRQPRIVCDRMRIASYALTLASYANTALMSYMVAASSLRIVRAVTSRNRATRDRHARASTLRKLARRRAACRMSKAVRWRTAAGTARGFGRLSARVKTARTRSCCIAVLTLPLLQSLPPPPAPPPPAPMLAPSHSLSSNRSGRSTVPIRTRAGGTSERSMLARARLRACANSASTALSASVAGLALAACNTASRRRFGMVVDEGATANAAATASSPRVRAITSGG